ncbi:unnamed protein product [Rhizophagus irregularis]|nr:unnamed protein product [Rhizophagus irregularis]
MQNKESEMSDKTEYGVEDGRITDIPQIVSKTHKIDDNDEAMLHYLKDIRLRLKQYGIKVLKELICITEGKQYQIAIGFAQNVIQCESAHQTNKRKRKADDVR